MEEKKLSDLTDQELLQEAKKRKKTDMINAALIGFLIGVIAYSIIKHRRFIYINPFVFSL